MDKGLLLTLVAVLALMIALAFTIFILTSFPALLVWLTVFVLIVFTFLLIFKGLLGKGTSVEIS